MGYKEKVFELITVSEHRIEERQALWQCLIKAFDEQGSDGIKKHLAEQIEAIKSEFDDVLAKLETML